MFQRIMRFSFSTLIVVSLLISSLPATVQASAPMMASQGCSARMGLTVGLTVPWQVAWNMLSNFIKTRKLGAEAFYLDSTQNYNGSKYLVVNMRTGDAFANSQWQSWGFVPGTKRVRIGMSSRWVLERGLQPLFDPWILLYNC